MPEHRFTVQVKKLEGYAGPEDPLVPAENGDVGVDIYAKERKVLRPGEIALVGAGFSLAMPRGVEAQVRPKSGRALKEGLSITNAPGTVDPGYRGEMGVIVQNVNPPLTTTGRGEEIRKHFGPTCGGHLNPPNAGRVLVIEEGQKIAQIVFARFLRPHIEVVEELPDSERGVGGFGSTGLKVA